MSFESLFIRIYRLLCKLIQVLSVLRIGVLISSIVRVFGIFSDYWITETLGVSFYEMYGDTYMYTCIALHWYFLIL